MFSPRQQIGHQGSSEEPWVCPESELLQGTEQNHCEVLESKDQNGGQMTAGLLVRGPVTSKSRAAGRP